MLMRFSGKTQLVSLPPVYSLLQIFRQFGRAPRITCLALALSLSVAIVSAADEIKPKSPAQAQFEQGMALMGEQKYGEAETSFKKALEIDSKFAPAYLGLSDVRLKLGDSAGAGAFLQKAVGVAPNSAAVQTAWGQYLFSQKKFTEAKKAYETAIQLDPKSAVPRIQLGDLNLLGLRKPEEAILAYQAALALKSSNVHANFMLATALLAAGNQEGAVKQLLKTRELDPKNLSIRKTLADLQLSRGELDAAGESYGKVLEISPKAVWARIGIGDVNMRRKDYDRAIEAFQEALRVEPRSAEAQTKLGMSQQLKGDIQSAEASYRSALEMDSKNGVAANNLAWLLCCREERPKEALPWALKAVASDPQNANFLDTEGWVRRGNGDAAGALVALKKANTLAPDKPAVLYHLGVVYQESGKTSLAAEAFKKALAINTTFEGAKDAQARLDALQAHI